jgi:hypothetical protein
MRAKSLTGGHIDGQVDGRVDCRVVPGVQPRGHPRIDRPPAGAGFSQGSGIPGRTLSGPTRCFRDFGVQREIIV